MSPAKISLSTAGYRSGDAVSGRFVSAIRAYNNPIEELSSRLQLLPAKVRWLYAQEGLIEAVALGREPERGPRSRLADGLVALSSRVGLGRALAAMVNSILLTLIFMRQSLTPSKPANGALFVGIKTLRESELVRRFGAMQAEPVIHLDERGFTDFFRVARVPFSALLKEMRAVWKEVWDYLDLSQATADLGRDYLLSFFLMNGHRFAFLRAWARHFLSGPTASRTVACTSASYVPFAFIAAGAEMIHMEHGFQRHSLVYPDFAQSICFNAFEAEQVSRRLPGCLVTVAADPAHHLETRRTVAVAGISVQPDDFDLIRPFMDWALHNKLPIIVRKHSGDRFDYWEQWRGVPGVEITEGRGSFAEFLDRFRPRFLTSWFSTTLYDAIVNGVVPITVTPDSHEAAVNTVFPFRDICMCWPEHKDEVQNLLDDDGRRAAFLADRYARIIGTHRDEHDILP
jgi:hypothetical protein